MLVTDLQFSMALGYGESLLMVLKMAFHLSPKAQQTFWRMTTCAELFVASESWLH
jgi:hypothetical protein